MWKKITFLLGATIFFISFIIYDVKEVYPFVNSVNVNKDGVATDSVWAYSVNRFHNDAIFNTILKGKKCICNPNSWYVDYFRVFSDGLIFNQDVPNGDVDEAIYESYEFVGYNLAYNHETLVDHQVKEIGKSMNPGIYLRTDDLTEAERVVAFNDQYGNVFIVSEENWNEN